MPTTSRRVVPLQGAGTESCSAVRTSVTFLPLQKAQINFDSVSKVGPAFKYCDATENDPAAFVGTGIISDYSYCQGGVASKILDETL